MLTLLPTNPPAYQSVHQSLTLLHNHIKYLWCIHNNILWKYFIYIQQSQMDKKAIQVYNSRNTHTTKKLNGTGTCLWGLTHHPNTAGFWCNFNLLMEDVPKTFITLYHYQFLLWFTSVLIPYSVITWLYCCLV
jgi:hypothetical protein